MGTASLTVTPPLEDMERRLVEIEQRAPQIVNQHFRDLAERGLAIFREEAPKRTGKYASQFGYLITQIGPNTEVHYRFPEPLTTWLSQGTGLFGPRMQLIRPLRARVLHFFYHGVEVFARWVRGMPPNPFLDAARIRLVAELGIYTNRIGNDIMFTLQGK